MDVHKSTSMRPALVMKSKMTAGRRGTGRCGRGSAGERRPARHELAEGAGGRSPSGAGGRTAARHEVAGAEGGRRRGARSPAQREDGGGASASASRGRTGRASLTGRSH